MHPAPRLAVSIRHLWRAPPWSVDAREKGPRPKGPQRHGVGGPIARGMGEGLSYAWEALKDTSELARSLCPKAHPVRPRPGAELAPPRASLPRSLKKSAADVAHARVEIVVFGGEDRIEKIVADLMPHCGWAR